MPEGDEHFFLELHTPTKAVIGRVRAQVTIPANDWPKMTVADAAATEGDAVAFVVSLSAAGTEAVAVDWAASAGSGDTATVDDFAASGGADHRRG